MKNLSHFGGLPRLDFSANQAIFHDGDNGDQAFIVESGEVEIARVVEGHKRVLGIVREGEIFGELALIDREPRMADAVALRDTTCVVVERDLFQSKFGPVDPFIKAIMRVSARSIRSLAGKISRRPTRGSRL